MSDFGSTPRQIRINELQEQLTKAAEFGKTLLDGREELAEQIEAERKEYTETIEATSQENYDLRHKLEMQYKLNESLVQENESIFESQQKKTEMVLLRSEEGHAKRVKELQAEKAHLSTCVEKLELKVAGYDEKISQQAEYIEQLVSNTQVSPSNSFSSQKDISDMAQYISELEKKNKEMEISLLDSQTVQNVLGLEKESLESEVDSLKQDMEERTQQASQWFNSLQAAQEEVRELKIEIDSLRTELNGDEKSESGNSLFAEVEDRRIASERQMISLQTKYASVEKAHQQAKLLIKKQKTELMSLLCRYSREVTDAVYMRNLNRALEQSNAEVEALTIKLSQAEHQESHKNKQLKECYTAFGASDKKYYLKFLESEIEQLKEEKRSMAKDLDMKRKQLLCDNDKFLETNDRLRMSEQQCTKLTNEWYKFKEERDDIEDKLTKETADRKDLEVQIKYLEEELKARKGRKKDRRSMNPSHSGLAAVEVKSHPISEEDKPNEKDKDPFSSLSAEEATKSFIEEIKNKVSKKGIENTTGQRDPSTGATNLLQRKPVTQHDLSARKSTRTEKPTVNQCPQQ